MKRSQLHMCSVILQNNPSADDIEAVRDALELLIGVAKLEDIDGEYQSLVDHHKVTGRL